MMSNKPMPYHSKTPTGPWGFFKELMLDCNDGSVQSEIECSAEEKGYIVQPIIDYSHPIDPGTEALQPIPSHNNITKHHYDRIKKGKNAVLQITITGNNEKPLILRHLSKNGSIHTTIISEEGSSGKIIEIIEGEGQTTHLSQAIIKKNSQVEYNIISRVEGDYLSEKEMCVEQEAKLILCEYDNNLRTYARITTKLKGESAEAGTYTLYHGEKNTTDQKIIMKHEAPKTKSMIRSSGTLKDSEAVYESEVFISQKAVGSEALQKKTCLIIDKNSSNKCSPRMYIKNKEVTCTHSASIRRINEDEEYYIMSRGLSKYDSESLIIQAETNPILDKMMNEARHEL